MSTSKEISLILSAKLEASDAVNQAQTIGKQIASSLEDAFEGLGQRIAEKIFREMKTQMSSFNFLDNTQSNKTFAHDAKYDNMDISRQFKAGSPPPATNLASDGLGVHAGTAPPSPPPMSAIQSAVSSAQNGNVGQYLSGRSSSYNTGSFSLIAQHLGRGLTGSAGSDARHIMGPDEAYSTDSLAMRVKAGGYIKQVSPNADVSHLYTQDELKAGIVSSRAAVTAGSDQMGVLAEAIKSLKLAIDENNAELKSLKSKDQTGLSDTEKENDKKRIAELQAPIDQRDKLQNEYNGLDSNVKGGVKDQGTFQAALDAPKTPFYKTVRGIGTIVGVAQAVGQVANFANNFSMYQREGEAGTADYQRMGTRNLMNGNYSDILATHMMGGEDALKSEAARHSYLTAIGKIGLGAAGAIGGAAMTVAGATATAAGVPIFGVGAIPGALATSAGVSLAAAGVAGTVSGIHDFMTIDQRKADYERKNQGFMKLQKSEYMDMYGASMGHANQAYQGAISMGSQDYSSFLYGGGENGTFMRSMNSGLSRDQMSANAITTVRGIGGVFGRNNILGDSRVENEMVEQNRYQGIGFANAASNTASYFRSGTVTGDRAEDFKRSGEQARGDYLGFSASGMEMGSAGMLSDYVGSHHGMGENELARYNANTVVGSYNNHQGNIQDTASVEARLRTQDMLSKMQTSDEDGAGFARARAVQKLVGKLTAKGIKVTEAMKFGFLKTNVNASDFKKMGPGKLSDTDTSEFADSLRSDSTNNLNELLDTNYAKGVGQEALIKKNGATEYSQLTDSVDLFKSQGSKGSIDQKALKTKLDALGGSTDGVTGKEESKLLASKEIITASAGLKTLGEATALLNKGLPALIQSFMDMSKINPRTYDKDKQAAEAAKTTDAAK